MLTLACQHQNWSLWLNALLISLKERLLGVYKAKSFVNWKDCVFSSDPLTSFLTCRSLVFVFTSAVNSVLAWLYQDFRACMLISAWAPTLLANHLTPKYQVSLLSTGLYRNKADASAKVFLVNWALATRTSSQESHETRKSQHWGFVLTELWELLRD